MSLQPPPQQPVNVYPTTVTNQPSSHSNGNYGPVFIVLAILLVISVVGCFLGRLCNRRKINSKNNQDRPREAPLRRSVKPNRQQQIHDIQSREDEDVELGGIDKRRHECQFFRNRIYNETNIDTNFATLRKTNCPSSGGDTNLAPLDSLTPTTFDNNYYTDLIANKGLLHSDQALFNGVGSQLSLVRTYSRNTIAFKRDFAAAMIKLSRISPLTGTNGEIRKNCRLVN